MWATIPSSSSLVERSWISRGWTSGSRADAEPGSLGSLIVPLPDCMTLASYRSPLGFSFHNRKWSFYPLFLFTSVSTLWIILAKSLFCSWFPSATSSLQGGFPSAQPVCPQGRHIYVNRPWANLSLKLSWKGAKSKANVESVRTIFSLDQLAIISPH
jgi:hypothetical protein